jgi:hypothetical protein
MRRFHAGVPLTTQWRADAAFAQSQRRLDQGLRGRCMPDPTLATRSFRWARRPLWRGARRPPPTVGAERAA